jgi:hypothetical protein
VQAPDVLGVSCALLPADHLRLFSLVRSGKEHRGVDLISDALPFGRLWYAEPDAISNTVGSIKFYSRPALLAFLISWAMSSRLASLPLLGKERLLFLLGTNHFLD